MPRPPWQCRRLQEPFPLPPPRVTPGPGGSRPRSRGPGTSGAGPRTSFNHAPPPAAGATSATRALSSSFQKLLPSSLSPPRCSPFRPCVQQEGGLFSAFLVETRVGEEQSEWNVG
ncbi:hypothetical protein P7K49_012415 [Saguinus oedipus]|uniref:Uncharacterized protein n=1 Tax=Saguinus oedipus TaxID=9490 RepID=A0ABQ9VTF4_SAGOE|nr:hypothetical protein P7K49_012415 [Saguinus oedipus]